MLVCACIVKKKLAVSYNGFTGNDQRIVCNTAIPILLTYLRERFQNKIDR